MIEDECQAILGSSVGVRVDVVEFVTVHFNKRHSGRDIRRVYESGMDVYSTSTRELLPSNVRLKLKEGQRHA